MEKVVVVDCCMMLQILTGQHKLYMYFLSSHHPHVVRDSFMSPSSKMLSSDNDEISKQSYIQSAVIWPSESK